MAALIRHDGLVMVEAGEPLAFPNQRVSDSLVTRFYAKRKNTTTPIAS